MKINGIAFVSYPVTDVPRARKFYEEVLGLKPTNVWEGDTMAFIEYDMGPHTLAIGKGAPSFSPGLSGGTAALEVEDFEVAMKELKDIDVKFILDPTDTGGCHMALVKDPDGNQIMIHRKKPAK